MTTKNTNEGDEKPRSAMDTYFKALILISLGVIAILLMIYAAINIFGPSEKTIMAPGPTGSTNSIEKPLT